MNALFYDFSSVQHQNPVGITHGGKPVGDDDAGAAHQCVSETCQDPCLGLSVDGA
jgi:hypothetical protein